MHRFDLPQRVKPKINGHEKGWDAHPLKKYNRFLIQFWVNGLLSILPFYCISKNWDNIQILIVFTVLWFGMVLLFCMLINAWTIAYKTKTYPIKNFSWCFIPCFDFKLKGVRGKANA
jgi:hypothetical protein